MDEPVIQALVATLFTWGVTMLGAATVFAFREVGQRTMDAMLGFAGGVMLAASYWSLLAPAIDMAATSWPGLEWLPAAVGFLSGGLVLLGVDQLLPHLHIGERPDNAEGVSTSWRRAVLLVLAITLHNIPEGLAVGVAFGAAGMGIDGATVGGATALAIGIGLQNFPEGVAVSVPLHREGTSKLKAFWYGQLSALVEPVAGVIGAVAVTFSRPVLPFALSFAAGAMVYVVVEEVVPEAQRSGHDDLATVSLIIGFTIMMILDVALG
jgi:ZIP family zinc transporter